MIKLHKEQEEIPIDTKIAELEKESASMRSLISAETHIPTKERLIANRAEVIQKISILREQKHQTEQVEYDKKLEALITENREVIFFAVNDVRHSIGKNNEVEMTFSPCKHKIKLHVRELLRKGVVGTLSNKALFEKWNQMMKTNITYSSSMYCQQCQQETQKTKSPKHIPSLSWSLRRLQ